MIFVRFLIKIFSFLSTSFPTTLFKLKLNKKQKKYSGVSWTNSASHVAHQVGVSEIAEEPELEAEPEPKPVPKPVSEAAPIPEAVVEVANHVTSSEVAEVEPKRVSVEEPGSATRARSRSKSKKRKEEVGGGLY